MRARLSLLTLLSLLLWATARGDDPNFTDDLPASMYLYKIPVDAYGDVPPSQLTPEQRRTLARARREISHFRQRRREEREEERIRLLREQTELLRKAAGGSRPEPDPPPRAKVRARRRPTRRSLPARPLPAQRRPFFAPRVDEETGWLTLILPLDDRERGYSIRAVELLPSLVGHGGGRSGTELVEVEEGSELRMIHEQAELFEVPIARVRQGSRLRITLSRRGATEETEVSYRCRTLPHAGIHWRIGLSTNDSGARATAEDLCWR